MYIVAIIILVLILAILLIRKQWDRPLFQYVFLCRVPLICGLLLITLPFISHFLLPKILGNLLIISTLMGVLAVMVVTIVAGYMVVQTTEIIVQQAPDRMNIAPLLTQAKTVNRGIGSRGPSRKWARIWAVALALPMGIGVCWLSWAEVKWGGIGMFLIGLVLGWLLLWLAGLLGPLLGHLMTQNLAKVLKLEMKTANLFKQVPALPNLFQGYGPLTNQKKPGRLGRNHAQMIAPIIFLLVLFLLGSVFFKPGYIPVPALFFVVFLIAVIGYLLAAFTFFLDRFRFPLLIFLTWITVLLSSYSSGSRHHYILTQLSNNEGEITSLKEQAGELIQAGVQTKVPEEREPMMKKLEDALAARLKGQSADRVLVAFAVTGGGIQAAGWTAQVLTGLHENQDFGSGFLEATGLISSVSGGSVGAMFFLDRLKALEEAKSQKERDPIYQTIRENAMANGLPAVSWALAYQDAFRLIGFNWLGDKKGGRGWALEESFRLRLKTKKATFRDHWLTEIKNGHMPLPIFNATLVESGDRFLISPLVLPLAERAQSFATAYPEYDIGVATAARLSSTFPYVSPLASPWHEKQGAVSPGWHVADGGYFDTYGIFTLIEWLNTVVLPKSETWRLKRIIIVQINAFPDESSASQSDQDKPQLGAWEAAVIGPVKSLVNVRVSTQMARNRAELDFLRAAWRHKTVKICHFDIRYLPPSSSSSHSKPPLSWKLSHHEKENIRLAWDRWLSSDQSKDLASAWQGHCPCKACRDLLTEKIIEDELRKKAVSVDKP